MDSSPLLGTSIIYGVFVYLRIGYIEVEGVISFYHFLSRLPTGKNTIYLNRSIVSECKGFERVKEAFEMATGATIGSVDPSVLICTQNCTRFCIENCPTQKA